jgi:Xaa-Pro aminopeptidase
MDRVRKILVLIITSIFLLTLLPIEITDIDYNQNSDRNDVNLPVEISNIDDNTENTRGIRIGKVAATRKAAEISDEGMKTAKAMLERAWTENLTEADVVRAIDQRIVELGSSSMIAAFGLLVVSGNDTGISGGHGDPTDDEVNQILPGEVVIVDIGARYNGYVSDITRTFFMGEPTEQMREVYAILEEAQEASIKMVKHGTPSSDIDLAARNIIESYGYGEEFSHCLGHGIGLYVHIPPTICPDEPTPVSKARDDIITIEPGIYIENDFGIRIEDDVIVDWLGSEIITFYPKSIEDLIVYGPEDKTEQKQSEEKSWWETEEGMRTAGAASAVIVLTAAGFFVFLYRKQKKMMH